MQENKPATVCVYFWICLFCPRRIYWSLFTGHKCFIRPIINQQRTLKLIFKSELLVRDLENNVWRPGFEPRELQAWKLHPVHFCLPFSSLDEIFQKHFCDFVKYVWLVSKRTQSIFTLPSLITIDRALRGRPSKTFLSFSLIANQNLVAVCYTVGSY